MTSEASTLSALIGDIYDAALDPTLWTRALEHACAFVGGSSAAPASFAAKTQRRGKGKSCKP